jgi:hypothetical protein
MSVDSDNLVEDCKAYKIVFGLRKYHNGIR